ncbi:hypothetical protein WR25_18558 isoform A [Diploscapter pachys]|nr:hypothetical protein WR25_18558 isoform A [Diploscapter pachys]
MFSHPADFTPVCTTELSRAAQLADECVILILQSNSWAFRFASRHVKMIALSCDSAEAHRGWIPDIRSYARIETHKEFPFEIITDSDRKLAKRLDMIDPDELDSAGLPLTARAVFFIDPTKKLRAQILYPATTGRDFHEILRVIDSLQLTAKMPVATPEGWRVGDECMVQPWLPAGDAEQRFGKNSIRTVDLPSGRPYLRFTKPPSTQQ